jgi:hypothetical protein
MRRAICFIISRLLTPCQHWPCPGAVVDRIIVCRRGGEGVEAVHGAVQEVAVGSAHTRFAAPCAVAPPGSLAVTIISVDEQFLGWYTGARQAKRDDEIASAYDRMTGLSDWCRVCHWC